VAGALFAWFLRRPTVRATRGDAFELKKFLDSLPLWTFVRDASGRFVYVSRAMRESLGLGDDLLPVKGIRDYYSAQLAEKHEAEDKLVLSGEVPLLQTETLLEPDATLQKGRALVVSKTALETPLWGRAVLGIAQDITCQKDIELALARERDFIRVVLDTSDALIAVLDGEGRLVRWNRAFEQLTGYHESDVRGAGFFQRLIAAEERVSAEEQYARLLAGDGPRHGLNKVVGRNGRPIYLSWTASLLRVDSGDSEFAVLTAMDRTQQVVAERQQRQVAMEMRVVWESAGDAMAFLDEKGLVADVNPSFCALVGQPREKLVGQMFTTALREWPGHEDAELQRYREEFAMRGMDSRMVREYQLNDGQRLWLEIANSFLERSGQPTMLLILLRNITSRVQVEQELRATNEFLETTTQWAREMAASAEMASAAKSAFLANVSHEIRTPMNGILGMTELALMTELNAEQREYMEMVRQSAEALLGLVNDLLDLSKAESGRVELMPEALSLRRLLDTLMRPLLHRGAARGLQVDCKVDAAVPEAVVADGGRLRQILINLVGNAIKFTDAGGVSLEVDVVGREEDAAVLRFVVRDTGIGMEQDRLASIFQPFTQLDSTSTRRRGGTGLGLSISAKLVELMGGRLFVTSAPGQGSAFSFIIRMPVAPALVDAGEQSPMRSEAEDGLRPLRILVAEDNSINQRLVLRMLERAGCVSKLVGTGKAAVQEALQGEFDAILMDVQMPELDGIEATLAIRSTEAQTGKHVPIIAMTAHAMPGDKENCLAAGMDGYLSKPIRLDTLIRKIESLARGIQHVPEAGDIQKAPEAGAPTMNQMDQAMALSRVGGDANLLAELAGLFLAEYPQLLGEIGRGVQGMDAALVQNAAHQLKGLLAQFGADQARDCAWQLELAGKQANLDVARRVAEELQELMDLLRPELEAVASR